MTTEENQGKKSRHQRHFNEGRRICPVCGLSIRRQELVAHHEAEMRELHELTTKGSRNSRYPHRKRKKLPLADEEDDEPATDKRYEEYLRLRRKRETRRRDRALTEHGDAGTSGQSSYTGDQLATTKCPVCGITLTGSPDEMNRHAEACLIQQNGGVDEEGDNVNIDDDDESFEEYTWCGQTRVRATTLLEGGLQGCGYKTVKSINDDSIDDELDVEGDESLEFGPIQYTEDNLIHLQDSPEQDTPVNGTGTLEEERHSNVYHDRGQQTDTNKDTEHTNECAISNGLGGDTRHNRSEVLNPTEMIKQLQKHVLGLKEELQAKASIRCLVCLDMYRKPVVSVQCWHVYCEDCWLRTLGAKKLCPQCQMITSPAQLRRIYL